MNKSNIFQKLNSIQESIRGYIKKDTGIGYGAARGVTHDAVTAHIRAAMISRGVLAIPYITNHTVETVEDSKGRLACRCTVLVQVTYYDCENQNSYVTAVAAGVGDDFGDKAMGKAYSYAVKNAHLKVFMIETGEDDESRVEIRQKGTPITAEQANAIQSALSDANKTERSLMRYLASMPNPQVSEDGPISSIPQHMYDRIIRKITASNGGNQ